MLTVQLWGVTSPNRVAFFLSPRCSRFAPLTRGYNTEIPLRGNSSLKLPNRPKNNKRFLLLRLAFVIFAPLETKDAL